MAGLIVIRPVRTDEAEKAKSVLDKAIERYLAHMGISTATTEDPYDYMPEAIADGRVWCADVDGVMAGVAQVGVGPSSVWKIDVMGVLEDYAGHGIGRALLEEVEECARARGIQRLELITQDQLVWLWQFYERLGFRVTRRGPPPHGLDSHIRVFMEKALVPLS